MNNNKKKSVIRPKTRRPKRKPRQFGIPRNLQPAEIMPPFKNVQLSFIDPDFQIAAATTYLVKSFRVNDPYDPDPRPLTTGYTGFEQLMVFYEFYRANSVRVEWNPANQELFPIMVGLKFSQIQLDSVILTRQAAIDTMENGIATQLYTLQRNAGGPAAKRIVRSLQLKNLLGNPQLYEGSPDYTGTATTSPTDQLWVNLIVIAPTSITTLSNGVIGSLELQLRLRLFGTKTLDDTLLRKQAMKVATTFSTDELQQLLIKRSSQKSI